MSEKSHGREEIRLHIVCDVPDELIDFTFEWKGLKKLCVAVSFRSIIAEQKKEPEMTVRYYISSADLTAEKFATAIRNHWHVENKLHWRLDVVMNEDDCKIRRGNAAELFSGIRHIAINILTNDKVFKAGLRRKMRKAAMDRNYLASVLAGAGFRNLSRKEWDARYPQISRSWRANWPNVATFFVYPEAIRKVIYTTNAIESLNSIITHAIKKRKVFPTDESVKSGVAGFPVSVAKWTMPLQDWRIGMSRFIIEFGDRLDGHF